VINICKKHITCI